MLRWILLLATSFIVLMTGKSHMSTPSDTRIFTDIPYYDGEDATPRHVLDLYLPATEDFPIVLYVHGGAWVGGDKNLYANIGTTLAEAGYGVAIINYRLSPEHTHPAHTQDGAYAIAWLVAHIADYGGNPHALFLTGHSAGGHMVSLLALDSQYLEGVDLSPDIITGIISYSGLYWIDDWIMGWAGNAFPDGDEARRAVSPIHLVEDATSDRDLPPFLMIASERDYPELLVEQAEMAKVFDQHGVTYEAHVIPNHDHFGLVNSIGTPHDPTTAIILDWLKTHLQHEDEE